MKTSSRTITKSHKTSVDAVYNNQTSTSASQLGDVGVDLKWRLEFD